MLDHSMFSLCDWIQGSQSLGAPGQIADESSDRQGTCIAGPTGPGVSGSKLSRREHEKSRPPQGASLETTVSVLWQSDVHRSELLKKAVTVRSWPQRASRNFCLLRGLQMLLRDLPAAAQRLSAEFSVNWQTSSRLGALADACMISHAP